jgi:hypothetical protein
MEQPPFIHLHCLWRAGERALRDITRGIAHCGLKGLPRSVLTATIAAATCPECLRRVANARNPE